MYRGRNVYEYQFSYLNIESRDCIFPLWELAFQDNLRQLLPFFVSSWELQFVKQSEESFCRVHSQNLGPYLILHKFKWDLTQLLQKWPRIYFKMTLFKVLWELNLCNWWLCAFLHCAYYCQSPTNSYHISRGYSEEKKEGVLDYSKVSKHINVLLANSILTIFCRKMCQTAFIATTTKCIKMNIEKFMTTTTTKCIKNGRGTQSRSLNFLVVSKRRDPLIDAINNWVYFCFHRKLMSLFYVILFIHICLQITRLVNNQFGLLRQSFQITVAFQI